MLFTDPRNHHAKDPAVVRFHGHYYMYYSTWEGELTHLGIGIARSENLTDWTVIGDFPETQPCGQNGIGAPGAIVLDDKVHLFYQTYGNGRRDAICHAVSEDGVHFAKNPDNPVYRPTADVPVLCRSLQLQASANRCGGVRRRLLLPPDIHRAVSDPRCARHMEQLRIRSSLHVPG